MSLQLKELCNKQYKIKITPSLAKQIIHHETLFVTRRTHSQALNTALIGIDSIHFTSGDQQHLFDICNISKEDFKRNVHSLSSVDSSRIVTSDPYNLFTIWLSHLVFKSQLPSKLKEQTLVVLYKLLHYKFFTSVVNYNYPYKANEAIMTATIDNLSAKFDIKDDKTPTWRLVIQARSYDVIDKHSIHHKTISSFGPDNKILYVISDIQTRIRTRIKLITRQYYNNKERGDKIESYGLVDEIDGEKKIKDIINSYDSMITGITNSSLNTHTFVNNDHIKLIGALNKNLRPELFRTFLMWFSNRSIQQYKDHNLETTEGNETTKIYKGNKILINNIIQKTYRICVIDKVNMGSKLDILEKTRNLYRTSRTNDEDIQSIKNSVEVIIQEFGVVKRESTQVSLKIGFLLYIVLLSFEYI